MQNSLKVILLDDEQHALGNLAKAIQQIDATIEICGQFTDPIAAIVYAKTNPIDIFFLDISMPLLNGFEVLEKIGKTITFKTVFLTAHSEYAINAIKQHVFDYLLKPIDMDKLKNCLIATKLSLLEHKAEKTNEKIILRTTDKIHFIDPEEIIYLTSDNSYTKLILLDTTILSSKSISHYTDLLEPSQFFRCHNSFIVQKKYINEYNKKNKTLILSNQIEIPVSRAKKDSLLDWLFTNN